MSVPQAKNQSLRLIVTLAVTCVLAGGILAAVYGWMNPLIEAQRLAAALSQGFGPIFPDGENYKELELAALPQGVEGPVYEIADGSGNVLGIGFVGASQGFGGPVRMAIGVDPKTQTLVGVRVLEHTETPGLGSPIEELSFLQQLEGKSLSDPFRIGNDVQGLTGATVSSRAVFDGASTMARAVLAEIGLEVAGADMPAGLDEIFPNAAAVTELAVTALPDGVEGPVYEVTDGSGKVLGIGFIGSSAGFGGPVRMAIGVDPNTQTLVGVRVLEHSETPGLGSPIEELSFLEQLEDKALSDPFQIGVDVQGLTAATVSSKAVFDGASKMGRAVLAELGYEVKVAEAAEPAAAPAPAGPEYADAIFEIVGGDASLTAADLWEVRQGDDLIGVATVVTVQGYGGPMDVLAVVDPKAQSLVGVRVLKEKETPGLGSRVKEPGFLGQFVGKTLTDSFKVGDDVDGITMATISAQAVSDAAKQAIELIAQLYAGS